MEIILKSVRIYGSKDYYGKNPRTRAKEQPIVLANYPRSYRTELWLGDVPRDILEAYKVRYGIGRLAIERLAGLNVESQNEIHERIEKYMREEDSEFKVEKWNWYVSQKIEHVIEMDDKFTNANKYFWLESKKVVELNRDYFESTQIHHDRLSTFMSSFIEPSFFSKICFEGVFFDAEEKISFGFPKFSTSAEVTVSKNMDSLKLNELKSCLKKFVKTPASSHEFIDKARHWYLTFLRERDPWRKFMFGFYSLEILTHKLCSKYYKQVCKSLNLDKVNRISEDKIKKAISELVPKIERLDLAQKFAIVALGLSPTTALDDLKNFRTLKNARDRLSHGDIKNADELPNNILFTLLKYYFDKLVKF